ncbi:MAG: response regulator [Promethearchaeota archaeon]
MRNEGIKVLFVEDDETDRLVFEKLIKIRGLPYDYKIANSVREAKKILGSEAFEIVITDYMLGDGTSFELFELFGQAPVIFVTGVGTEEIAVKAMKSGVYDYVVKDKDYNYIESIPEIVEGAYKRSKIVNQTRSSGISTKIDPEEFFKGIEVFCAKFADKGPLPISHTPMKSFGSREKVQRFVTHQSMFYQVAVGQGHLPAEGLFGPFPVRGYPDKLSFVYSFKIYDSSVTDPRLVLETHAIVCTVFDEKFESYFPPRKRIEEEISSILENVEDLAKIPKNFASLIKSRLPRLLKANLEVS